MGIESESVGRFRWVTLVAGSTLHVQGKAALVADLARRCAAFRRETKRSELA